MGIRFDQHVNGTKSLLSQAIKEYGLMNFDSYIISICLAHLKQKE
jgi:hypothetical protein